MSATFSPTPLPGSSGSSGSSGDRRDDEVARLRVPPHSIEAEQSVLGGLLIDNSAWDRAGDLLTESDFYRFEHKQIFLAVGKLINAAKPADVVTVFEELTSIGKAEECGGLAYLNALAQSVPSAANLRRYAEIVRERAILRKLVTASDEIATAAMAPQGRAVTQILDEAEGKIFRIGEEGSRSRQGFQSMDNLVVALIDRVNELAENGAEDVTGVRTGFFDLDRQTAGLQPGDLIVLAARPSMGKTAFAVNIAENVAINEGPARRHLLDGNGRRPAGSAYGGFHRPHRPGPSAHRPAWQDDEWGRLSEAVDKLGKASIFIDESPGLSPSPKCAPARVARRASAAKLGLIVVDYLQLMSGNGGGNEENRATVIGEISRGLKALAKELQVPRHRAVAAEPLGGAAARQAAHDVRPARVGRHRAGCRHHHVHLPR